MKNRLEQQMAFALEIDKAKNIFRLINRKMKFNPTQPDVLSIKEQLIEEIEENSLLKI